MVRIDNLYVETIIGFYHWEHEEPQPLQIDLELGTDFSEAFNPNKAYCVMLTPFQQSSEYPSAL
jgi:dihydroneopterin aldolase